MLFFYTQKNHKQRKKEKKDIFYSLAELTQKKMEISMFITISSSFLGERRDSRDIS